MIRALRNIAAGIAVAIAFFAPAHAATTGGTDYSDAWFLEAEAGWGVFIIHQGNTIFATLYVYNQDGSPRFYSGSETRSTGPTSFSGPLYDVRGTYFGSPWAGFTPTQVGVITFNFSADGDTATMNYNVGSTSVTKNIRRFPFALENLTGRYIGGATASSTCGGQNQLTLIFDDLRVTHSGGSINMTVNFTNAGGAASVCTFSGTYNQPGKQGRITGNFNCTFGGTPGNTGTFTISNIDAQSTGFLGRFSGQDNFCSNHTGFFGGVKDVI
jgi:hypothetical protein